MGEGVGGTCSAHAQKAEQSRGQMSRSGMRQSSWAKFFGSSADIPHSRQRQSVSQKQQDPLLRLVHTHGQLQNEA